MEDKLEYLLTSLDDEIDRKCLELKKEKQEETNMRVFTFACTLFICLPLVLFFAGVHVLFIILPIVCFFAINLFVLSPIILNNDTGDTIQ